MNRNHPHPAILRMREANKAKARRLHNHFSSSHTPPTPQPSVWQPKNPDIAWPHMNNETLLTQAQWEETNFPSQTLPTTVTGVVNITTWNKRISELLDSEEVNMGLVNLMREVGEQLTHGADSHVGSPGTSLTHGENWVSPGANSEDTTARIADALASFTTAGHMAGPLFKEDVSKYKINPILAIKKPGGHVRVVGNLKSPKGNSFNEGIPEPKLSEWPVNMLTARKFAQMIVKAGRGALMSCSDMCDAYKMIPICLKQRKLQAYRFCGALFVELKLIFGDRLACQYFDRFHDCILRAFVLPMSSFPPVAQGRTVDDIPAVAPKGAEQALRRFVQSYRTTLNTLNIMAAPDDPACTKAFDCSTEGEVLGTRFNTVSFTWSLPHDKLHKMVTDIHKLATGETFHSLRELESIVGKLNNVSRLCPALKTLTGEAIFEMTSHINTLIQADGSISDTKRDSATFRTSPELNQDLLMAAAIMSDTYDNPLPIIDPDPPAPLCAVPIYPDASGHIAGPTSPCLGVLFPSHNLQQTAAFSFPFPTDFLLHSNGTGLVADTTTTLESLGILIPMITNPHRCAGKALHIFIDNIAVVFSFKKRRSNDKLAHTIIRASYLIAGALACKLFVSWTPRRSDVESVIADDLTHMDFSTTLSLDPHSYRSVQPFPPPIREWMKHPSYDRDLGHHILSWMATTYQNLL